MPAAKPCEHGLPISKCTLCHAAQVRECMRRRYHSDPEYRERQLRRPVDPERRARNNRVSSSKAKERYANDPEYREEAKLRARRLYALDGETIRAREREKGKGRRGQMPRHYKNANQRFHRAKAVADRNAVPYTIFYRCKVCQRSTPNVNKHCDHHQDVYQAMQQAIELYQLTKQLKKGIRHERYQKD